MKHIYLILALLLIIGCTKKLDLKPASSQVIPTSNKDLINLLDNYDLINSTPGLTQISADEYFIPDFSEFQSLDAIERNAYIWNRDIFQGKTQIDDWIYPYRAIFYANSVLDVINKQDIGNDEERKFIKGWALFIRGYHTYLLTSLYAKAYNETSASTDLGIPLKLTSAIEDLAPRSSVQRCYDQMIEDIVTSGELLNSTILDGKRNRPSKVAAYGLLARIYLSMRKYQQAELYADKSLNLYSTLINYSTLDSNSTSAFTDNSPEVIFATQQIIEYVTSYGNSTIYGVDPELIALYSINDLRIPIYFMKNTLGNYNIKPINTLLGYPFTGLATDEMYLIKAECLARRGMVNDSMLILNKLVRTRFGSNNYIPIIAVDSNDALDKVLTERRKELVWRGTRWVDLKRLNLENRNITIKRTLNGQVYTLDPNSPKYVLPIPDDEIILSHIEQNVR